MTPKYARRELERRFLLAGMPAGDVTRRVRITDRYVVGTRLRLRTMDDGRTHVFKLTQKVPAAKGNPGLVTTIYLDAAEHAQLSALPAVVLEKTRHHMPPFTIDSFAPPRQRLWLAEVELDTEEALHAVAAPPWAIAEVTADARFTGGRLAETTAPELDALLASFGL